MKLTDDLYKVLENNNDSFTIMLSDKEHPIFQAHFPSHPILPGFLQLDIAQEVIKKDFQKFKKIKFIQPVLPSSVLTYNLNKNKITIYQDNQKISEFTYE